MRSIDTLQKASFSPKPPITIWTTRHYYITPDLIFKTKTILVYTEVLE